MPVGIPKAHIAQPPIPHTEEATPHLPKQRQVLGAVRLTPVILCKSSETLVIVCLRASALRYERVCKRYHEQQAMNLLVTVSPQGRRQAPGDPTTHKHRNPQEECKPGRPVAKNPPMRHSEAQQIAYATRPMRPTSSAANVSMWRKYHCLNPA